MTTWDSIYGAVRTQVDQGIHDGDIDADSSKEEIVEYLRQSVEVMMDWPPAMVSKIIVLVAEDMRPD